MVYRGDLQISTSNNPGGNNAFLVVHTSLDGSIGRWSGKPPGSRKHFTLPGPSDFGGYSGGSIAPAPSWSAANLWARTNPSRPAVLLPVFWVELRDIPDMIRQAGRFLLAGKNWKRYIRSQHQTRDLATANLAFQFGWAPLVGDLYKIASFQDAVDKRRKEFQRATRAGGFRRRITVGGTTITGSSTRNVNFGNYRNFTNVPVTWSSTSHSWAVLKWIPNSADGGLPSSDLALRAYLTGLHPSHILANVWEALPWSWLIDYFTNIGDVIQAGNHTLLAPGLGSFMTTTTNVAQHIDATGGDDILSPGTLRIVRKSRTIVGSSAVSARIPSLGAGQLSILGSLATLKGRRTLGS